MLHSANAHFSQLAMVTVVVSRFSRGKVSILLSGIRGFFLVDPPGRFAVDIAVAVT